MRSIILAAGSATRFNGEVKGLLPINGEAIIARLVRQLKKTGVESVYVVVGYRFERFVQEVEGVSFIYDKNFKSGRNSDSLKVALDTIGFEDTLMLDADVILTDDLIPKLLHAFDGESVSLVDMSVTDEEAMKIVLENERIIKYSKDEGVGAEICSLVSKDKMRDIYKDLETGEYRWWGVGPHTSGFKYVAIDPSSKWSDVDTQEEYEEVLNVFKNC
jgi:choline kinase